MLRNFNYYPPMRKYILLVSCCAAVTAIAQSPIDTVIKEIIENNSELRAKEQELSAMRCDDTDANSLANPEVEFTRVWGKDGIGNKLQLDISQSFDWPGLYRARRLAARQGQSAAEMAIEGDRLELAMNVKELLVELVYVRKQLALIQGILDNIALMQQSIALSLEQGQITVLDERKAAYEAFKYENQAAGYKARDQEISTELQALSNAKLDLSQVQDYPLEPLLTNEEYLTQLDCDPALQSQAMTVAQEELNAKAARQSRFPSFSLGYEHQAEMGDRFNGVTASMTLPFFENRKARQAALLRRDAADLSSQQLKAEQTAEINGKYESLKLCGEQMQAFRQVFGDNRYISYLDKAYQAGELTVLDYINEVHYYQEQTLTYLEIEHSYFQALGWLNRYELLK